MKKVIMNLNRKLDYVKLSINKEVDEISKTNFFMSDKKNNKILEDNIYIEPVRNAEIQIIKDCNEILVEGITNKRGIMKYVVDKNENNLLIKISKTGYYRVERVFKRNNNMKENLNKKCHFL